jgi:hypothetical protein
MTGPKHAPTTCEQNENIMIGQAVSLVVKRSAALAPTLERGMPAKQPASKRETMTPAYVGDRAAGICRMENRKMPVV